MYGYSDSELIALASDWAWLSAFSILVLASMILATASKIAGMDVKAAPIASAL
jgi:hypothetical protein